MSNKTYDFLKRLVQVILPATGALYFGLASYWDLPNPEGVVGSIAVITTFLGVSLGISTSRYESSDRPYDGNLVISTTETGKTLYSLELNEDVNMLDEKDRVVFRMVDELVPTEVVDEENLEF